MSIAEKQKKYVSEFDQFQDWESRYRRIIELGKSLKPMPAEFHDDQYKVRGCQSQVWLHASMQNGQIEFVADSDALIVKGLVAILIDVYSGAKPDEILASSPQFLREMGLDQHLSPSRTNGLYAMIKQFYYYATAFQALAQGSR